MFGMGRDPTACLARSAIRHGIVRIVTFMCRGTGAEEIVVKRVHLWAVILGCVAAAGTLLCAQAPANGANTQTQQKPPSANQQTPAQANPAPTGSNPFPEDESTVPVMPTKNTPDVPEGNAGGAVNLGTLFPAGDMDPVHSPDNAGGAEGTEQGFSSSSSGIDSLLPPPGADADTGKKHGKRGEDEVPEHHETAAEDESVGKYYLDNKNWHAALSRYESAMVLDPDNPDVYWGMAESQRHLGQFAEARANYQKVMEYDPDSRHAKDAKKALQEPELANAKPNATQQPPAQTPQ
jgi:tetratricopeptide (TPR) repeat protein